MECVFPTCSTPAIHGCHNTSCESHGTLFACDKHRHKIVETCGRCEKDFCIDCFQLFDDIVRFEQRAGYSPLYSQRCRFCYKNDILYPSFFYGDGSDTNLDMKKKWHKSCSDADCILCLDQEERLEIFEKSLEEKRKEEEEKASIEYAASWSRTNRFAELNEVVE